MSIEIVLTKEISEEKCPVYNFFEYWLKKQMELGLVLFGRVERRDGNTQLIYWCQFPYPDAIAKAQLTKTRIHNVDCVAYLERSI